MTVAELRRVLADVPDGWDECPVVFPAGQVLDGERVAAEVGHVQRTSLVPPAASRRRFWFSAVTPADAEHARPAVLLTAG